MMFEVCLGALLCVLTETKKVSFAYSLPLFIIIIIRLWIHGLEKGLL